MTTRIYVVIEKANGHQRLVEAVSPAQAIRHCVRNLWSAAAATPKQIAHMMGAGVTIEKAFEHELEQPTQKGDQTT